MGYAYGSNKTSVKKGGWRSKNDTANIIECENPIHCTPNLKLFDDAMNSSANHLCRVGHVGPVCSSCDNYGDFWNDTYQYSAADGVCVNCSDSSWTIIFFFVLLIGIGLFTFYTVNK